MQLSASRTLVEFCLQHGCGSAWAPCSALQGLSSCRKVFDERDFAFPLPQPALDQQIPEAAALELKASPRFVSSSLRFDHWFDKESPQEGGRRWGQGL